MDTIESEKQTATIDFDPKEVYSILKSKGVAQLHHANTVGTSKTFLENSGLLSRGYVDRNGLYQTTQSSDKLDKHYGIWDHVFLDGLNLAETFSRYNRYGPVLFKFDLSVLLSDEVNAIRITRVNPIYWPHKAQIQESFYFTSLESFDAEYLKKSGSSGRDNFRDGGTMFMIETNDGRLSIGDQLNSIEVDNPGIELEDNELLVHRTTAYLDDDIDKLGVACTRSLNHDHIIQYDWLYKHKHNDFCKLYCRRPNDLTAEVV